MRRVFKSSFRISEKEVNCDKFLGMLLGFDIRITPTVDLIEFEKMIEDWCKEAGSDVTYEFLQV